MTSIGSRRSFLVLIIMFMTAGWAAAQVSQFPPTLTLFGRQDQNMEGTRENPFTGIGIDLRLDIQDPDPTFHLVNGWNFTFSGNFCNSTAFIMFGKEGLTPIIGHPGVRTGIAQINVMVRVTENPHPPIDLVKSFFIVPEPIPCPTGTPQPDPPPPPSNDAPRNVTLTTSVSQAAIGETVILTGRAQDDGPVTFSFFSSSVANAAIRGTLISQQRVTGCTGGCVNTTTFRILSNTNQYFLLEARDDQSQVVSTTKRLVEVGTTVNNPEPNGSPVTCNCPDGGSIRIDAGPTQAQVVGGNQLILQGEANGPVLGGAVIPGSFQWTVPSTGGLNGLSFADPTQTSTTLFTPDISQDSTATIRLTATFGNCTCNDNLTLTVLADAPPEADLAVSQTESADPINQGGSVTYDISVVNNGPDTAQNVVINDIVPSGATFASASTGCSLQQDTVLCPVGNLANGTTASASVTFNAGAAGTLQNVVFLTADSPDSSTADNSASESTTVAAATADLILTKSDTADPVKLGDTFQYILQVTNNGPDQATNVNIIDQLPAGVSLVGSTIDGGASCSGTTSLSCPIGTLNVGASATVVLDVRADAAGTVTNTATVTSGQADSNGANNTATETTVISDSEVDLQIVIDAAPSPVGQDKNLRFTVGVTNNGPDSASGVTVVDVLPGGLDFISASPGCINAAGTVTCALGDIDAAETKVITITVLAVGDGQVTNSATVNSAQADTDSSNNSASVTVSILSPNFLVVPTTLTPDTFIGLALVNTVGDTNTVSVQGLDHQGQVQAELNRDNEIAALGQDAFLTSEVGGEFATSDVILIRGLEGPFQSFFMMGDGVTRLDGIGTLPDDSDRLVLPRARQTGDDFTKIFLFNPSPEANADVTLQLFGTDGVVLNEVTMQLAPSGSILGDMTEIFDSETTIEDGYIRVQSTAPLRGFELVSAGGNFATMPAQRGLITSKLFAPHFFIGNRDQGTLLRVVNLNPEAAQVRVRAFDDSDDLIGESTFEIPPNALIVRDLADLVGIDDNQLDNFSVFQGFLEFDLNGGTQGPFLQEANVVPLISYVGVNQQTFSTLPIPREGRTDTLFLQVAQSAAFGIFTGLAVHNTSSEPAEVTVEAFDTNGDRSGNTSFVLAPRSRVVGLLNNSTFFGGDFEQVGGYLRVTSPQEVTSFALFGGPRFLSAIDGQPPLR